MRRILIGLGLRILEDATCDVIPETSETIHPSTTSDIALHLLTGISLLIWSQSRLLKMFVKLLLCGARQTGMTCCQNAIYNRPASLQHKGLHTPSPSLNCSTETLPKSFRL
jgi:hypothetical protein